MQTRERIPEEWLVRTSGGAMARATGWIPRTVTAERIDDEELLRTLAEAGMPTGLIRMNGVARLADSSFVRTPERDF